MKFLKRFKKHKSIIDYNDIKEDINDILLTINDNNIKYLVNSYTDDNISEINITFRNCRIIDIKEELLHLSSFLKEKGYNICRIEFQNELPGSTGDELHNVTLYDMEEIEESDEFIMVGYIIFSFCIYLD